MKVHLRAKLKFTFMTSALLDFGAVNFFPWVLPLNIHEQIRYFVEHLFYICTVWKCPSEINYVVTFEKSSAIKSWVREEKN